MPELKLPRPVVTVATIVMRDGAFLCVEEEAHGGVRLNQPAGHLEAGETLLAGAMRETLEETGYTVAPAALVGIYRWHSVESASTYVRFCFAADVVSHDPTRPLDHGIVRAGWFTREVLVARRAEHRSPLVMRCVDDFLGGRRLPLAFIIDLA